MARMQSHPCHSLPAECRPQAIMRAKVLKDEGKARNNHERLGLSYLKLFGGWVLE